MCIIVYVKLLKRTEQIPITNLKPNKKTYINHFILIKKTGKTVIYLKIKKT